MNKTRTIVIAFLLSIAATVSASVIRVPDDRPTIQKGIDAASDGDTVLVADGTYTGDENRDLDFKGKAIAVKSENGPANCVIDCEGSAGDRHRGFYFHRGEGPDSVLKGFTIKNGYAPEVNFNFGYGGGIFCDGSSPKIKHNIIMNNTASWGGGIYCGNCEPIIVGNTISGNTAVELGGGAILCDIDATPMIIHNIISGNTSLVDGGGILCTRLSAPAIIHNSISDNTVAYNGGGICYYARSISNVGYNFLSGNVAGWHGGGIFLDGCFFTEISNNILTGNSAGRDGGGIRIHGSELPYLINNLIIENSATEDGGGICCSLPGPVIIHNNTISANTADSKGGGIVIVNTWAGALVTNTILWNNDALTGNEFYIGQSGSHSILNISYSDVDGGQDSVFIDEDCTECILNWGTGMMDADPLFAEGPMGGYYLSQIAAGQGEDSLCADAGDRVIGQVYPNVVIMPEGATRTDHVLDTGIVDIGFHYPIEGVAIAGGSYQGRVGKEIIFDASLSFDPDGNIAGYRWDWTDDGIWDTAWLSDPVISHIYYTSFHGKVKLQVKDDDDHIGTDMADVDIIPIYGGNQWLEDNLGDELQPKEIE